MFHFCAQNCICLKVQWISREYDWSVDNNWLVPPVFLIAHTIKHIQLCSRTQVESAIFWSMLVCPENSDFISIVKYYKEYETPSRFFVRG